MTSAYKRASRRPTIGTVFWIACGCWAGVMLAETLTWNDFREKLPISISALTAVSFACAILLIVVTVYRRKIKRPLAAEQIVLICLFSLIAFVGGCIYWMSWVRNVEELHGANTEGRSVRVISDARDGIYGKRSDGILVGDDGTSFHVTILWASDEDVIEAGMTFETRSRPTPTRATESSRSLHQNGTVGSISIASATSPERSSDLRGLMAPLRTRIETVIGDIGGEGSALIRGILLGDRSALSGTSLEADFRTLGLAHLLAVSGSHLAIVASIITTCLQALRTRRFTATICTILAMVGYIVLSGIQLSALRAAFMATAGMIASSFGRRRQTIDALSLCAMLFALIDPPSVFSFSLRLSICALMGIAVFSRLVGDWLYEIFRGRLRKTRDSVTLTTCANMTTLPLTVPMFSTIPLLSPFSNALVVPAVALLLGGGIAITALSPFIPAAAIDLLFRGLCACANVICAFVHALALLPVTQLAADWPAAISFAIGCALMGALWIAWPRPTRKMAVSLAFCAVVLILVSGIYVSLPRGPQLVMLDVGQGDSLLLKSGGTDVLIDTGDDDAALLSGLASEAVTHLDAVFITHLDDDHYVALEALRGVASIDAIYMAEDALDEEYETTDAMMTVRSAVSTDRLFGVEPGDVFHDGPFTIRVLYPDEYTEDGGNGDSLCLLVGYDGDGNGTMDITTLLTGDAEHPVLAKLEDAGLVGHVDILKVGHHGSSVALDESDIACLDPAIALISVGADNRYGHPSPRTLGVLEEAGVAVYRTDRCGCVRIRFEGDHVRVTCDNMEHVTVP